MAILTQYPSASLILFALVFVVLEGVLPHRPVDRRREWPLDLLAVAAGVVFVVVAYGGLRHLIPVLDALAPSTVLRALRTLPSAAKVVLVVLLVDFTIYWLHRFMHRWPVGWRMHRWHHTIEQMYWFAGFRASFLHVLLYGVPQVFVPTLVFDLDAVEVAVATAIANFVQVWTHSNIQPRLGPLQWWIVTPDYHRLHHRTGAETVRNFGNLLTVWDRLFRTHESPPLNAELPCGLGEPRPGLPRMLLGL